MRTVIRGGLVVDATGREPRPGAAVAIEDGRIVAIAREGDLTDYAGPAEVIDASGCTVLPGLIDCHVHVLGYPRRNGFDDVEAAVWGTNYLQAPLRAGVTTLRDVGEQFRAIFALRKGVADGWITGPRLLIAGQAICMTGGHVWDTYSLEADGPDAVRRAARLQIKAGVDVIKLMATGGAGTVTEEATSAQLTVEEMRAGVEEAHKAGLPTAAHATSTQGIKNALLAGIDCIEHGCHLDDVAIELMLRGGVGYSPTLSVYRRIDAAARAGIAPAYMGRRSESLIGPHLDSFRKALAAGVKITMGTDSGSAWHPLGAPPYELELWVQAGMKPLAALEAATRVAAEVCHIGQEVGTLEPDKRADVLIVEGDATNDIGAMGRVRRVLRDGATVFDAADGEVTVRKIGHAVMGPVPWWLGR